MDHAEIKHLIPLKALSRLDGDEARAVDDHLAAGCDECERELASFTEALAAMAIAERRRRRSFRSHLESSASAPPSKADRHAAATRGSIDA